MLGMILVRFWIEIALNAERDRDRWLDSVFKDQHAFLPDTVGEAVNTTISICVRTSNGIEA